MKLEATGKARGNAAECAQEAADEVLVALDWVKVGSILLAGGVIGDNLFACFDVLAELNEALDDGATIGL